MERKLHISKIRNYSGRFFCRRGASWEFNFNAWSEQSTMDSYCTTHPKKQVFLRRSTFFQQYLCTTKQATNRSKTNGPLTNQNCLILVSIGISLFASKHVSDELLCSSILCVTAYKVIFSKNSNDRLLHHNFLHKKKTAKQTKQTRWENTRQIDFPPNVCKFVVKTSLLGFYIKSLFIIRNKCVVY